MTVYRVTDGVVLTGRAIDAARYAVSLAQRARAGAGLPPSAALAILHSTLTPPGQPDTGPDGPVHTEDMITSDDAARLIGCSPRTARRLAPQLGGRLTGGRWLLDRQAVIEHLQGSQEDQ
ncbi:helix-turn-helix domain-containing protein [Microlunatus sp. Y2014]|uniref:helix-turn-helix domain-containing protein n=1 Tax=Microlunatus sp. Y2014 TaxID=3418488 RepID=UPI003DA79E78